ncbi:MAG: exodeoxyribonuclease V subunit gamma [Desulfomicrobiaceae bacterium]|nr:exodeoxyribonuclease V subunit gamma [Desulfomicrobiaceae bacterium]
MALTVFLSNRLEYLATLLADHLKDSLSPLTQEIVVVQSRGMERYLAMTLAREHGICAGVRFPFPAALLHDLARRLRLPGARRPLSASRLLWRLMAALEYEGALLGERAAVSSPCQRMGQAVALASVFERYQLFRPHWLAKWQQGVPCGEISPESRDSEDWQRRLWQRVVRGEEESHRAALTLAMIEALRSRPDPKGLPHRVAVFGISSAPPHFVDLLAALGAHIPVHVYVLGPSAHTWGRRQSHEEGSAAQMLALLGSSLRDALDRWEECAVVAPLLAQPAEDTLLGCLHADLLHLPATPTIRDFSKNRANIEVHLCATPRREVEVLRERLLHLLETDPTLEPHHILAITADMDAYAPLIHAVFGSSAPEVPYAVADHGLIHEEIRFFLDLLRIAAGRLERSRVQELFFAPPTRGLLGLSEDACLRLQTWFAQAGIAWGIDAAFRQKHGAPPSAIGTWRAGLTRLALGAITGDHHGTIQGVAPLALGPSEDRELFAACALWLEHLEHLCQWVQDPAPDWERILPWMLETFWPAQGSGAPEELRRGVAETLNAWKDAGRPAACGRSMAQALERALNSETQEGEFLARGITFCAPRPMRAVPFRVVAFLGLAAGNFPRTQTPPCLDLTAAHPRPGDRTPTDDDRGLFLDALLSARDRLLLFAPSAGPSALGPSPVLASLLEHLDSRATVDGASPSSALVTTHPFFAFHPRALDTSFPWPTTTRSRLQEAHAFLRPQRPRPPFFRHPLPRPQMPAELELGRLIRDLAHPCRTLLHALGIRPHFREEDIPDDEPCRTPAHRTLHRLKGALLELAQRGASFTELVRTAQAWQVVPDTPGGEAFVVPAIAQVMDMAQHIRAIAPHGIRPHPFYVEMEETTLCGTLPLAAGGIALYRPATLKTQDLLRLYLTLIVAGTTRGADRVTLITEDHIITQPVPDPKESKDRLRTAIDLWLEAHTRPVALLPKACLAYAQAYCPKGHDNAHQKMVNAWTDGPFPENQDPYLRICFPDTPHWDEAHDLAQRLLVPMLTEATP